MVHTNRLPGTSPAFYRLTLPAGRHPSALDDQRQAMAYFDLPSRVLASVLCVWCPSIGNSRSRTPALTDHEMVPLGPQAYVGDSELRCAKSNMPPGPKTARAHALHAVRALRTK